jgi:uncharacterized protein YerC
MSLNSKEKSLNFIDELFTSSEKVMLAKRLAILVMLKEGLSQYAIWNTLNVSPATVTRISRLLKEKRFDFIENLFADKRARKKFLRDILIFIYKVAPPRPLGSAWKYIHNIDQ